MKTVLNVDGKQLAVSSIHNLPNGKATVVYAADEKGREIRFVDNNHSKYDTTPHTAIENLDAAIDYPEFKEKIVEGIQNKIESLTRRMDRIANEFIQAYKSDDSVFTEHELASMQEEYHLSVSQIEGLQMAIPLVLAGCDNDVQDVQA